MNSMFSAATRKAAMPTSKEDNDMKQGKENTLAAIMVQISYVNILCTGIVFVIDAIFSVSLKNSIRWHCGLGYERLLVIG